VSSSKICGKFPDSFRVVLLIVTLPPTVSVEAMSTAPSMSTTSRLVVPSTSISPEMSRLANTDVPVAVTVPDTSALPLMSISVAVRSISSVAPNDRTVALEP